MPFLIEDLNHSFQPARLSQADQSIVIDEQITVAILEIRLGIEAPKEFIDTGMLTMIAV
ncbi:MAG: carbon storage regulator [Thermoguttaceae bacterium]